MRIVPEEGDQVTFDAGGRTYVAHVVRVELAHGRVYTCDVRDRWTGDPFNVNLSGDLDGTGKVIWTVSAIGGPHRLGPTAGR